MRHTFRTICFSAVASFLLPAADPSTFANRGGLIRTTTSLERQPAVSADGNPKFIGLESSENLVGVTQPAASGAGSRESKAPLAVATQGNSMARSSNRSGYTVDMDPSASSSKGRESRAASAGAGSTRSAVDLASGTTATFTFPGVASPTLFTGDYAYKIVVPQGATRLTVRLSTTTPNTDTDLFLRYGSEPRLNQGHVQADFASEGPTGEESLSIGSNSSPALRAGTYYVAIAVFRTGIAVTGRLTATVEGAAPPPTAPPVAPTQLSSGTPVRISLPAVASGTLFSGDRMSTIQVPAGTSRLVVHAVGNPSDVDIDLFVRRGAPPTVNSEGHVVADHSSESQGGDETVRIDAGSSPSLQAGVYYIALASFTPGRAVTVTLTASVETEAVVPTSGSPSLPVGSTVAVQFPSVVDPTLFTGDYGYRIEVPAGTNRLQIRFTSAASSARVQLFLRYGANVTLTDTALSADHASPGASANEVLTITPASNPALRPGVYYLAFGVFSVGTPVNGTVSVAVDNNTVDPNLLSSGTPANFELPAVDAPTMFTGDYGYRVIVPSGATRLEVRLNTNTPDADVDLYIRYGRDNEVVDGRPATDYASENWTGSETILITSASSPALRPGVYYISLGVIAVGKPVAGTVTAIVQ